MWRHVSQLALVFSVAALTAPASHASAFMCLGQERCGITRAPVTQVHADSVTFRLVVPMRSDGSQHGYARPIPLPGSRS